MAASGSDDYAVNLATYRAQLQQVEAALTNDPENEELVKLKQDLEEVIELTSDLQHASQGAGPSAEEDEETEEEEAELEAPIPHSWKDGDRCMACWSKDQKYYPATIDQVHGDNRVTVIFDVYENVEVKHVTKLKDIPEEFREKKKAREGDAESRLSRKEKIAKEREYKKRKQQKKADRRQQQEQMHEDQKKSWINFTAKAMKGKKGFNKKSIFTSRDLTERNTGSGSKGMTKFKMPKHHVARK